MSGRSGRGGGSSAVGRARKGGGFPGSKRFEKRGLLGKGGVAEVWKAVDNAQKPFVESRLVAVKVPKKPVTAEALERLKREGGKDRRFRHDNLVRIFTLRGGERNPFVVMEYIRGENCWQLLERVGALPPRRVAEIGRGIAAGMRHMHGAGLIHRDIKLANVMVSGDLDGEQPLQVKLIDLGVARAPGDVHETQLGGVVGTAAYIAPEVAMGRPATEASDVYSAGIVLYELVTGQVFPAMSSLEEALKQRRSRPLRAPHELDSAVPRWLGETIMRAIEIDPGRRHETAAALGTALEDLDSHATQVLADAAQAPQEDPTRVMAAAAAAAPATEIQPRSAGRPGGVPGWVRERLVPRRGPEPGSDGNLLFFIKVVGWALFFIILIPVAVKISVTLYSLPPAVLTGMAAFTFGAGWVLRDAGRREQAARAASSAWAALRQAASAQARPRPRPRGPRVGTAQQGDAPHAGEARVRPRARPARSRRLRWHGERIRAAWSATQKPSLPSCLREVRPRLVEARDSAGVWARWLVRRAFLVVVAALIFSLAVWLAPALQLKVETLPAGHRLVLTAVPALLWALVALAGFLALRVSRARPPRLVLNGLILFAVLAGLGLAAPSLPGELEPVFWPPEESESQERGKRGGRPDSGQTAALTQDQVRWRLRARIRHIESRWIQLLWGLQQDGWTGRIAEARQTVRDRAAALVSLLGAGGKSQFNDAEGQARRWLGRMEATARKLRTSDCRDGWGEFRVFAKGASANC